MVVRELDIKRHRTTRGNEAVAGRGLLQKQNPKYSQESSLLEIDAGRAQGNQASNVTGLGFQGLV